MPRKKIVKATAVPPAEQLNEPKVKEKKPRKARVPKVPKVVQIDYKPLIIDALDTLAKQELKDRNVFKARAYTKVIGQLKTTPNNIYSIDDLNKLEIEGIGKSIKDKIIEIITTGELEKANKIKNNPETSLYEDLVKIYGVGPVKAKDLIANTKHNIKSIEDLRAAVLTDPKFLNDKQRIGLKYFEDIQKRIPRGEVIIHDKLIEKSFKETYSEFITTVVGSYRRGAETSGDIDVLVTVPQHINDEKEVLKYFQTAINKMVADKYITDILALGPKKCMAFVKLDAATPARRLDILYTVPEEYPYALLYFTGSDKFNIKFRRKTLEQGYSLSEHGVKKTRTDAKELTPITTEKDIFNFFGVTYVTPENR